MGVVRGFEVLTGSYLSEDWDLYGPTIDDVLTLFAGEARADDLAASIDGLAALLASSMDEDDLARHWGYELHSGYDPRDDGLTYREWLPHALDILRAGAARRAD